jgi:glycosyltransferase involved in cell wall biosynthesis
VKVILQTSNAITVIILTKNEAAFIRRCIASVGWASEVLVLDCGSTDETQQIARAQGANVYLQEWLGWPLQRNKAITLAKNDWVMFLEADEIVTSELEASIKSVLSGPMNAADGYYLDRRGDFLGVLLPNTQRDAKRRAFVRLFNRTQSAYDPKMLVHEEVVVAGNRLPLGGVLLHWRGYVLDEYVIAFNRYATIEAQVLHERQARAGIFRIAVKPILRFFWLYVWKMNWRLGTRGLIHSLLKAYSEFIRYSKLWEMDHVGRVTDPPNEIYRRN